MKNNITKSLIASSRLDTFDNMERKNKARVVTEPTPTADAFSSNTLYRNPTIDEINQSSANTFTTKKLIQQ